MVPLLGSLARFKRTPCRPFFFYILMALSKPCFLCFKQATYIKRYSIIENNFLTLSLIGSLLYYT
jgi:hypothetical protein